MTLIEVHWFFTPMLVNALALLATLRMQRMRLTVEDYEYLRGLIRFELKPMQGDDQAPYLHSGNTHKTPNRR